MYKTEINKQNNQNCNIKYNHVLNKLQDYMLNSKLMANVSYKQNIKKDNAKNTSHENSNSKVQVKNKEKDRFFSRKKKISYSGAFI
jgi:hypothetical protein